MPIEGNTWSRARLLTGLAIDHLGIVVADCAPIIALFRKHGFQVSEPQQLMGEDGPLGQTSAHCVFDNGYIEISAPVPGSGNHLEPLLAMGEGIRILVLGSTDCQDDHRRLSKGGLNVGSIRQSSRAAGPPTSRHIAKFTWFEIADIVPGLMVAVVQHHDHNNVLHPELRKHPNGAFKITDVVFGASGSCLAPLRAHASTGGITSLINPEIDQPVVGISVHAESYFELQSEGFVLRSTYE